MSLPQGRTGSRTNKKDRPAPDAARGNVRGAAVGLSGGHAEQTSMRREDRTSIEANAALPPIGHEPVTDLYTGPEVVRLLGLSTGRLRSLDRAKIVSPSGRRRGRRAYTFTDLIALRAARDLIAQKVRLRDLVRAIDHLRAALPKATRPLSELRIVSDGKRVVVKGSTFSFEPLTAQLVLDFDVKAPRDDVVRILRPPVGLERSRSAYELYVRAARLDEDPATLDDAEALYRKAVQLDPWLAIAYTNLGNICFRRGDDEQAEQLYRKALSLEPDEPEAQYNLGYVMLDRGCPLEAIDFFKGAIATNPQFADAHFNLAMALEQGGQPDEARPCWRKYLDLEPSGTWSEVARKHL